jgi:antitoxin component YwqK of YwqJK toxin-antitoxin module
MKSLSHLFLVFSVFLSFSVYCQIDEDIIVNKREPREFVNSVVIKDTLNCDSIIQVYYKNGQLFYRQFYKDGQRIGWYEQFHENGTIGCKFLYIDGKIVDGVNVSYWENGLICQIGNFKNGNQIGKWIEYDSDELPVNIYIYNKRGYLIKIKEWDEEKRKWVKTGFR